MALDLSLSPETEALRDALLAAAYGETLTFTQLSEVVGRRVDGPARPRLTSARRILERDNGALFEPIRGVGLRRLPPEEVARIGQAARRRLRRGAVRAVASMKRVAGSANGLPDESRRDMSREVAALNLAAHLAEDRATRSLTSDDAQTPPPPAKAAKAFLDHIGADVSGKESPA